MYTSCHRPDRLFGRVREIREGVDKSLSRPTSRCSNTESILSLERGMFMCQFVSLFLLQGLKRKHVRRRARFQQHGDASCHEGFFFLPLLQDKVPKEIHTILTETLGEHAPSLPPSKTWWPSLNVVIFPPVMRLVLDDPEQ